MSKIVRQTKREWFICVCGKCLSGGIVPLCCRPWMNDVANVYLYPHFYGNVIVIMTSPAFRSPLDVEMSKTLHGYCLLYFWIAWVAIHSECIVLYNSIERVVNFHHVRPHDNGKSMPVRHGKLYNGKSEEVLRMDIKWLHWNGRMVW